MDGETLEFLEAESVPEDHPLVLQTVAQVARKLQRADKYEEAEAFQRQILHALLNSTESDKDFTLRVMHDLAKTCLYNYELIKEAVTLCEGMVKGREELRGPKHPDTLNAKLALGIAYSLSGSSEGATLLKEVVEIKAEMLGPKHLNVIELKELLFGALTRGQDFRDMLHLLSREIMEAKREVLGPEHPNTIEFARNLTFFFSLLSQHEEAISLWGGVVNQQKQLRPNHSDTEEAVLFLEVIEAIRDTDERF
ncbi:hypothetical protein CPB86DRAFT_711961 [Serendipita vermifera]|nr:hypothetical protein CPB86DRAFT_711961 [Serendipita vermifera]